MIDLAQATVPTVQTTGVNWESIAANAASVIAVLLVFAGAAWRAAKRRIKGWAREVGEELIAPLREELVDLHHTDAVQDSRLEYLRGLEEGRSGAYRKD